MAFARKEERGALFPVDMTMKDRSLPRSCATSEPRQFVRTDVRHNDEVKKLVDEAIARFGRLDIAVNNAGTVGNPGPAADVPTEAYRAIFDTNVLGVLLSMKYEIRAMLGCC